MREIVEIIFVCSPVIIFAGAMCRRYVRQSEQRRIELEREN